MLVAVTSVIIFIDNLRDRDVVKPNERFLTFYSENFTHLYGDDDHPILRAFDDASRFRPLGPTHTPR